MRLKYPTRIPSLLQHHHGTYQADLCRYPHQRCSLHFPAPSPQQALSAYHHILTHPVSQVGPANPAKHKVAMALLTNTK